MIFSKFTKVCNLSGQITSHPNVLLGLPQVYLMSRVCMFVKHALKKIQTASFLAPYKCGYDYQAKAMKQTK